MSTQTARAMEKLPLISSVAVYKPDLRHQCTDGRELIYVIKY